MRRAERRAICFSLLVFPLSLLPSSLTLPTLNPPNTTSETLRRQARRLDIRLRSNATKAPGADAAAAQKLFVHMLNSTLTATERTLCCVLENYQTPDGVRVPPFLQPHMMGIDFIPFRKMFDAKGKLVDRPKPAAPAASS